MGIKTEICGCWFLTICQPQYVNARSRYVGKLLVIYTGVAGGEQPMKQEMKGILWIITGEIYII